MIKLGSIRPKFDEKCFSQFTKATFSWAGCFLNQFGYGTDAKKQLTEFVEQCRLDIWYSERKYNLMMRKRCPICGKSSNIGIVPHVMLHLVEDGGVGVYREAEKWLLRALVQLELYDVLVKEYIRKRKKYWDSLVLTHTGCVLCAGKERLEDGTPNTVPKRCTRFDSSKNRAWCISLFGIRGDEKSRLMKKIHKCIAELEMWRLGFVLRRV